MLTINDNGKGFNTFDKSTGIGLKNIKNRAAVYNGEVYILSSVGNGCKMKVIFNGALSKKIITDNDIMLLNNKYNDMPNLLLIYDHTIIKTGLKMIIFE